MDFSSVRVHADSSNAGKVGALAYTQGSEVHVAPGQYRPHTAGGQQLLGHELTHVVQQAQGRVRATMQAKGVGINDDAALEREADAMGKKASRSLPDGVGPDRAAVRGRTQPIQRHIKNPIQRMSVVDTEWEKATRAELSLSGGTGGVAIVHDKTDKPVVVKAGEVFGPEVLVAGSLLEDVLSSQSLVDRAQDLNSADHEKSRTKWKAETVDARAVNSKKELGKIKEVVDKRAKGADQLRKEEFLDNLDNHTTLVMSYAPGRDFKDILENEKITKKGFFARERTADPKSITAQILLDDQQMELLGRASAVDIFTGNGDRLLRKFNPENYRIDKKNKRLVFIDHIHANDWSQLRDINAKAQTWAKPAYNSWVQHSLVQYLMRNDLWVIANEMFVRLIDEDWGLARLVGEKDRDLVAAELKNNEAKLKN